MNYKIKIKEIIVSLTVVLACLHAQAQDSTRLTLDEAVKLSISNSNQLKISGARITEANANVQAATDARLPNLALTGGYLRLGNANVDIKSSNNTNNGGGGVSPNQALYGLVNLSLPIYAGGKIKYGIASTKFLEQAARLDAENDKAAIAYNTIEAFVNLFKAQQAVAIIQNNLAASLSRDSTFANLECNGILARNDLLKSQLQKANIELTLLDAESNASLAMTNMDIMLGKKPGEKMTIDTNFLLANGELKTLPDYQALAMMNRKDVQAIEYRKKAAATGIQSARAEVYPTLALTGGYIAADVPKVLTITNAVNVGVGLQYNLASLWKKNTKLMQAKAKETEVNATEAMLNDAILLRVNKDFEAAILSKQKIKVYEKAAAQAEENYRITNNKYNNSLATITELLEANAALLQSQLNIQLAKADAALTYHKLLNTTGNTNY